MTIRLVLLAAIVLWGSTSPGLAQRSDVSGAVPMSDASGVLTQSDPIAFQSDDAERRMADVAAELVQALRTGTLSLGMTGTEQALVVPETLATLFLASSRGQIRTAARQLTDTLVAEGIPRAEAKALARASAELLAEEGIVDPDQFLTALHAFNAVVNAAPPSVLARPPQAFVVVRSVLTTLLDGTAS